MKKTKIKVGYLISYDYKMFFTSVKHLYNYVDKIYIAIDKEFKTWSGNTVEIPKSFFDDVKKYDKKNKIEFYFEDFYIDKLTPIECETRERNMLLKKMGTGWLIQLDVDEYVYDFKTISAYLNKYWYLTIFPKLTPLILRGKWLTLYRQLPSGYLYIENKERFSFITNQSNYSYTRNNSNIKNHYTNIDVIHQSWARNENEIQLKIQNWGHRNDFNTQEYFNFWKGLNIDNYKKHKNIHPIVPEVWGELNYLPAVTIDDFVLKYKENRKQELIEIDVKSLGKELYRKFRKSVI